MSSITPETKSFNKSTDWFDVSASILKLTDVPSLDALLEQALDAWLERVSTEQRWQVPLDLYTSDQVSSGRAAEIAGLNYFVFEQRLRAEGVPFNEADVEEGQAVSRQQMVIHAAFDLSND